MIEIFWIFDELNSVTFNKLRDYCHKSRGLIVINAENPKTRALAHRSNRWHSWKLDHFVAISSAFEKYYYIRHEYYRS